MTLYKITLEITDIDDSYLQKFFKNNANKLLVTKLNGISPNGYEEYLFIGNADVLIELLESFYDEGLHFFLEYSTKI